MLKESVEIAIEGFSGPLDLLCHMVESRQMQASKIKVAQLVRIYGVYLAKTKKASVDTLAEFFFMAAELLLQKTISLLPSATEELMETLMEEQAEGVEPLNEEEFLERLERYRPYRAATAWLEERKARQDRCYRRILIDEEPHQGEPIYDTGDLYFLSRIWWGLIDKKNTAVVEDNFLGEEEWDGVPEALPEESQIQGRIAELEEKLSESSVLSLTALWALSPSIKILVVTLLAVLEMCRMGKITIEQELLFSDVKIYAKH
jgi:segregation and condensation protein A